MSHDWTPKGINDKSCRSVDLAKGTLSACRTRARLAPLGPSASMEAVANVLACQVRTVRAPNLVHVHVEPLVEIWGCSGGGRSEVLERIHSANVVCVCVQVFQPS